MDRRFYMAELSAEKMDFVRENIIYSHLDSNLQYIDIYDMICWNKLHCEKGIYLAREGRYDSVYVRLPEHRHYWKIGEFGKTTYEEYCKNLEEELKKRDLRLEDLQLLQRYSSVAWYTSVEDWTIEKDKKLTLHVKESSSTDSIVDLLLYFTDGKIRDNLAEAHDLIGNNRFCRGETFDIGNFSARGFLNGKVEITMKDKSNFAEEFLKRFYNFVDMYKRAHVNAVWCTWSY